MESVTSPTTAGPATAERPLIDIDDITKIYQMGAEEVRALNGVTLDVERGEYLAIMGPSGSGKSTLMNMIGCLDTPTSGTYFLNGQNVGDMMASRRSICCRA